MKYFSITDEDVLITPLLIKYVFHHNYLVDKNYFHCSWSTTSSIAGGQVLLPLQVVTYFFQCSWSTYSIAGRQLLFHCRWSTASSIAVGQVLLPLQVVKYFFQCSWSTTFSIAACQLLPLQVVNYFFHCSWSTDSSILVGQVLLPL